MPEIIIRTVEEFDAVASQMRKFIRDGLEDKDKVVEVTYEKGDGGRIIAATVVETPKPAEAKGKIVMEPTPEDLAALMPWAMSQAEKPETTPSPPQA